MKKISKLLSLLFMLLTFTPAMAQNSDEGVKFKIKDGIVSDMVRTNMEQNLNALFASFDASLLRDDAKLSLPKKGITSDARLSIQEMWDSSPFVCDLSVVETRLVKTPMGGFEVRDIPVTMMSEEADEEHRSEMLLAQFDEKGDIENLTIAMNVMAYKSILANAKELELAQRQKIVNFIENFRTAYNRRDIKYLEQIYSDNALIITGRVIKTEKKYSIENQKISLGERYEYVKQTKAQYIAKLRNTFKVVKYLNVDFDDINVRQHPKNPTMYGVTLTQKWNASNYSDEGVLFLVIDFFDELNPLIQVRTWQPKSDVEENGVFSFEKIKI